LRAGPQPFQAEAEHKDLTVNGVRPLASMLVL
jgi:hypothetical protein